MIPLFKVFMPRSVLKPLKATLFSGYIGQGPKVEEFEQALADYLGNPYLLTTNNATAALHLSLRLAGVKPNDEVVTTPLTCSATNWPILAQGAIPVWADIQLDTGNLDPKSVAKNISPKTKAIIIVDWGGYPCDLEEIKKIAVLPSGKPIPIIEDAAHAFGAIYQDKKVGNFSDFTVFSFGAIKQLTSVEGGLLCVKNQDHYSQGKLLRWYGINRVGLRKAFRCEEDINDWGYKYNLNDVCAAIGLEQLKYTQENLQKARANAEFYKKSLKKVESVTLLKEKSDRISSYWFYTLKAKNRDKFIQYMSANDIMVSQVHRRNDTHPVVKKYQKKLPNLDKFSREMVCIPTGWWLSEIEREYMVKTIKNYKP